VVVAEATAVVVPAGMQRSASSIADVFRSARWAVPVGAISLAALGVFAWWRSAGWLFAAAVAIPAALAACIDVRSRRLPDRLVLLALAPPMAATIAEVSTGRALETVGAVALGALAMGGPPFVTHALAPDSLGFGDVKLSIVMGAALGTWAPVLGVVALAAASLIAVTESLVRRRTAVAFGPALVVGFVATTAFASPLAARLGVGMSLGWFRW
jgi:leader peptidase (prepilin peptidase)/N-methyltransferase